MFHFSAHTLSYVSAHTLSYVSADTLSYVSADTLSDVSADTLYYVSAYGILSTDKFPRLSSAQEHFKNGDFQETSQIFQTIMMTSEVCHFES